MNVGELFVSLGVKGSEKTIGAIASTRQGLKDTASVALETKVALIGAMYALERLFATSGQAGTDITNFNAYLGVTAKTLQTYQYAAKMAGVSNQEVEATFKGLSAAATNTLLGKGAPEGIARIAQVTKMQVGEMHKALYDASKGNVEPLFRILDQYARLEGNLGLRNKNLKDMNFGEGMVAASARNKFSPEALADASKHIYSDKEVAQLDNANMAWTKLGDKIEKAVGHFNAQHGGQLVKDISAITDSVLKLVEAFQALANKTKLFEKINMVFQGWGEIFKLMTSAMDSVNKGTALKDLNNNIVTAVEGVPGVRTAINLTKGGVVGDKAVADTKQGFSDFVGVIVEAWKELGNSGTKDPAMQAMLARYQSNNQPVANALSTPEKVAAPPMTAAPNSSSTQNNNVTQNLNFTHPGTDAKKTGDSVKKAVQDYFRGNPAIAGGY